jgi:hypothetical protein
MNTCYESDAKDCYIDDQMQRVKKNAIRKLELIVHPNFTRDIAKALALAFREGCCEADRVLINELELNEEEIYAIEDNFEGYKTHFEKNHKIEEPEDGYSF